ncbi:transposase [Nonomuraea sp. MG754425]|uniref:transposase n=1 Tax=Nonomuraea sp. MG754425 TaxID=2570319 RepID=UPI001F34B41A|nr:transposase [Nonomuraea sp. MG754425]MCF6470428.1 transposase [Nonomuraea sp. MG754425]
MDRRWVGLDGYEVVGAVRAGRQVLRVLKDGWLVADCTSVAEVAGHLDLADLCEVIDLPARRRTTPVVAARTSSHHR